MGKSVFMKVVSLVALIAFVLGGCRNLPAAAAPSIYKFDFGNRGVEKGYIGVGASDQYDQKKKYGFNEPENMINVPASGTGALSDAVEFLKVGTKSTNTFNVDLPNGLYKVTLTLGDAMRASVAAEGVYQIINLRGNNATDSFVVPIKDGQLNLLVTEGKPGTHFTLSSLKIDKLSHHTVMPRTIWIGGDSTTCNYYPLENSIQAGWGQMLPKFVNLDTFQVRNMASGGQIARGFLYDGQMEAILKYIKPGDYFLLEMGINDTNPKNTTTAAQFYDYMKQMVESVKSKGATPVLVTPQGRATDFNAKGVHSSVDRWYRNITVSLAREENIPLVDLNVSSSAYFTSIGPEATLKLYMNGDTLHPNRTGATELARIAAGELKHQELDGFTQEHKPEKN